MTNRIFLFLLLLPSFTFGQLFSFDQEVPTGEPDIYYYKFYNGIQMVELDYLSAYHRRVNYLEQAQPRAMTWEMLLGPPPSNAYLFRNEKGEIVKQYGGMISDKLLSVEASLALARTHNSMETQWGSVFAFSMISTRYFPYYLIGSHSDHSGSNLGLIDSLGNVVLSPEYSVIWKHDDLFVTRKGTINELRDIQLTVRFSCDDCSLQPAQFNRGHADVFREGKCGLMNSTGRMIVPCVYDMVIDQFNAYGLARVTKGHLSGFVDTTGKEVIKCKYDGSGDFSEGLCAARLNEKWGFIDVEGKVVIPHRYVIGIGFSEGLARVAKREEGKYYFGFIDKEGNEVIPLIYANAKDFSGGVAEVMLDGKWITIDQQGIRLKDGGK